MTLLGHQITYVIYYQLLGTTNMLEWMWNYHKGNRFLIIIKKLAPQTCAYATLRQSVANLMFRNVSFNFATAISKFDTFSSYHIIRTRIAKVTNFFPFALSKLLVLFPLLSHPKLLPLWSITDGQKDGQHSSPLVPLVLLFSLSARGPTYRRNSTGLPNYGVDGRLNKVT